MNEYRQRIKQSERMHSGGAASCSLSRGRRVPEPGDELMSCFQLDRDRIVHSKAFRRLAHKTQVFLAPEGDHYRVRLTHTLEVTQVARTIARALGLNEDLVEAICLGHDLGHTPFGHLGEEVVAEFHPGFRHNLQSLRTVDALEGLNLTWEVRDGIANHTWSMPTFPATLEGQVARYADRIAYINHDIDDSVRAGILREDDLPQATRAVLGGHAERIRVMVVDIVEASAARDEIRMSPEVFEAMVETRSFLFERVYVGRLDATTRDAVARVVLTLLEHYERHPTHGPPATAHDDARVRAVDYVAGMTDRFALRAFEALVGGPPPAVGMVAALQ